MFDFFKKKPDEEQPLDNVTRVQFGEHETKLFSKIDGLQRVLERLVQTKDKEFRASVEQRLETSTARTEQLQQPTTEEPERPERPQRGGNGMGAAAGGLMGVISGAFTTALASIFGTSEAEAHTTEATASPPQAPPSAPQSQPQSQPAPASPARKPSTSTPAPARPAPAASSSRRSSSTPMVRVPSTETRTDSTGEQQNNVHRISGMQDIKNMIKRHEGVRNRPYRDSRGLWTVGVGHLIGDGRSLPPEWNRTFSQSEIDQMFEEDFARHYDIAKETPGFHRANYGGKAGMIDLAFNMGRWWPRWRATRAALEAGDFPGAARGLEHSAWYQQVGMRARTIVDLIRNAGSNDGTIGASLELQPTSAIGGRQIAAASASAQRAPASVQVVDNSRTNIRTNTENRSAPSEQPTLTSRNPDATRTAWAMDLDNQSRAA